MSNNFLRQTSILAHHIEGLAWELIDQTKKQTSHSIETVLSDSENDQYSSIKKTPYLTQIIEGLLNSYDNLDVGVNQVYKYPALLLFLAHFKIVLHRKLKNFSHHNNMSFDSSLIESLEYSYQLFETFAGKKPLIPTKPTTSKDESKAAEFIQNIKKKQKALRSIS